MARRAMITPLTIYNIDNTVFDGIQMPVYNFPRSLVYDDLYINNGFVLDKETLVNNLLLETAELDTIYTSPEFFKFAVTNWAKKELPVWQSLYETLFYKYNPIWNKDGTTKRSADEIRQLFGSNVSSKTGTNNNSNTENENIADMDNTNNIYNEHGEHSGSNNKTLNKQDFETGNTNRENSESGNTSKTDSETENRVNNINEHTDNTNKTEVAAFDTSTFADRDRTVMNEGKTNLENGVTNKTNNSSENGTKTNNENELSNKTNIGNEMETGTDSNNDNKSGEDLTVRTYNRGRSNTVSGNGATSENAVSNDTRNENANNNELIKEYGNIGIITTQAMISAERDLVKFNLYDFIIDSFKARFCILIY